LPPLPSVQSLPPLQSVQSLPPSVDEIVHLVNGKKPPVLKGIDLITQRIKFNVSNLKPNHVATGLENADTILNPSGYIILYLTLDKPENGSYQVRISVNGEEIRRINIDALIPDSYAFDIYDPESLRRFNPVSAHAEGL
jgi:hypothetical protein